MSAVKHAPRDFVTARSISITLPWRRLGVYLASAAIIFLLGLIPMWLKAREATGQRDAARRELRLSQMQNALASAVIDARRGEYEVSRQTASDFFTSLREQVDAPPGRSVMTETQRERLRSLMPERDDIITLLARSDPAAVERLSDIYVSYRQAMSSVETHGS